MSDLTPSIIPLTAGLDLTTPKMLAAPGSLLDCLNYEVVDEGGLRRVDGYERYDGRQSPSTPSYYVITTASDTSAYTLGDILGATQSVSFLGGGTGVADVDIFFGVLVAKSAGALVFIPLNGAIPPSFGTVERLVSGTLTDAISATTIVNGRTVAANDVDFYNTLRGYQEVARGFIGSLPTPAVGLHWFKDRLLAAAGAVVLRSQTNGVGTIATPAVGELITGSGGSTGLVLATSTTGGASGRALLTVLDYGTGAWVGETIPSLIFDPFGTPALLPIQNVTASTSVAHLWEAVNPTLTTSKYSAIPELGWQAVEHGWKFNYTDGNSATGFLLKREKNSDSDVSQLYYFSDGVTDFEAYINSYTVDSGTFVAGSAAGIMQIGPLTRTAGTGWTLNNTYTIYSDIGHTLVVGEVSSTMVFNSLPGISALDAQDSRYEMITSNFYAVEALEAVYGVTGASEPFHYDGNFFAKIYTGVTSSFPRHIANHLGHLAVAYPEGELNLSVVGQPWNFSGLLGASSWAVGDRITGLGILQGTSLGIFCEQSVWSLVGSTVDGLTLQILVPNVGCIEYSLVDMGQPVYCSNWGITTLEQSASYGDFEGGRLSKKINKWLLPRLVASSSGVTGSVGVLCAYPARAKNQYRLVLRDGTHVSMTLTTDGPPAFTFQKHGWYTGDTFSGYVKPLAVSSEVDNFGRERLHFSTWDRVDGATNYVYEGNLGWSFDGKYIPHYFNINWMYDRNPAQFHTLQALRLYGQSQGLAQLRVQAQGVQNDMSFGGGTMTTTAAPINLPRSFAAYSDDLLDTTNRVDLAARGLAIQLKFSGSNADLDAVEPSHVAQVLITYSTPDGAFDL